MLIHDFDTETEPLIKLENFYGEPKHLVKKCLVIFSSELHRTLLETYECSQIGLITACNGNTPIYAINYAGEDIAFYLTGIGAAVASAFCYEVHWQTGATQFMMFGSCGSLDREATTGRFIIPTEAYRGEGTSYYYAEPADYIPVSNSKKLESIFEELQVPHVTGRIWTTDSMLRETLGLVKKRKEEGCIAVEMEVAGVQAVCDFYGLELFNFLEAGDVLEESGYDTKDLQGANHNIQKLQYPIRALQFFFIEHSYFPVSRYGRITFTCTTLPSSTFTASKTTPKLLFCSSFSAGLYVARSPCSGTCPRT